MALGKRCAADVVLRRDVIDLPSELIETLRQSPETAPSVLAGLATRAAVRERPPAQLTDDNLKTIYGGENWIE